MTKQEKIDLEYKKIGAEYLYPRSDTGYSTFEVKSKFHKDLVNIRTETCTDIYTNDSSREVLIPKALVGIWDNNGWNSIGEKGLPDREKVVLWLNSETLDYFTSALVIWDFNWRKYTHWCKINEKLPLY